jgi:hypothetical protein
MVFFYGEALLAPRPTPKLEDHPCITKFNVYMNRHFNLHKYSEENVYPPALQVWLYAYVIYCSVE